MSNGTASIPGWYIEFQANVLRQLPRPKELDATTGEGWNRNQKILKKVLAQALVPNESAEEKQIIIDCDTEPPWSLFPNWRVEEHRKGGRLIWDKDSQERALWQCDRRNSGDALRQELADKPVLNASVCHYLHAHQNLIPESWKGKTVFFFGTVFKDKDVSQNKYILCLYYRGGLWYLSSRPLCDLEMRDNYYIALCAS